MDPIVTGSLISAGASILGGAFGGSKSRRNRDMVAAERKWQQDMRYEDWERQNNYLQRRVIDARKAGLHPLYALGAQPTTSGAMPSTPNMMSTESDAALGQGLANAGQALGQGLSQYAQAKQQKTYNSLVNQKLLAEIGETRARTEATIANQLNATRNFVERSAVASVSRRLSDQYTGVQSRMTPNIMDTPFGKHRTDPKKTTASEVADRYGDIVEALYGMGLLTYDTYKYNLVPKVNRYRKFFYDRYKNSYFKQPSNGGAGW